MPTSPFLKALLLCAVTLLPGAHAAQVYFAHTANVGGTVDVYVDGRQVFGNILSGTFVSSPREIVGGLHEVVITPSSRAPGQADVFRGAVRLPEIGSYTLTFASDRVGNTSELALHLSRGAGDVFCSREDRRAPLVCTRS